MRILYVGSEPRDIHIRHIDGSLKAMQEIVGGYIEPAAPAQVRAQGLEMLVNADGIMSGLPCNSNLFPFFFVGNAFFVRVNKDEFVSLTDEDIEFLSLWMDKLVEG